MLLFINFDFFKILSTNLISIHLMLLFIWSGNHDRTGGSKFQYISCYCLSARRGFNGLYIENFNTSHVTVYLCLGSDRKRNIRYFNTSHVTVYQRFGRPFRSRYLISIHLMLLFIFFSAFTAKFKNAISIHLMLLFIATVSNASLIPCWFQYISCYCLSITITFCLRF